MTHNKLNRELEIECWREKRERVNDELEQLQAAMVADTTIWNQDNTTRCATLIGNLRYTDSKLKELSDNGRMKFGAGIEKPNLSSDFTKHSPVKENDVNQPGKQQVKNPSILTDRSDENAQRQSGKKRSFDEISGDVQGASLFSNPAAPGGSFTMDDNNSNNANDRTRGDAARKRAKNSANTSAVQRRLGYLESVLLDYRIKVRAFIGSPPAQESIRQTVYEGYSGSIFRSVIGELDQVEAEGEDRDRRRRLVKEATSLMKELDATVAPSKAWKPEQSFRARDKTGDFQINPIELD